MLRRLSGKGTVLSTLVGRRAVLAEFRERVERRRGGKIQVTELEEESWQPS